MYNIYVPNKSVECTILEKEDQNIIKILEGAAKGYRQVDIEFMLSSYGCVFYDDLVGYPHKNFDNYITRVQEKFRKKNIKANIYYGQIGVDNEFGYFLQVKEE